MPPKLRAAVERSAKKSGRSLNGEIVRLLEWAILMGGVEKVMNNAINEAMDKLGMSHVKAAAIKEFIDGETPEEVELMMRLDKLRTERAERLRAERMLPETAPKDAGAGNPGEK
jgi:hypothetical protein